MKRSMVHVLSLFAIAVFATGCASRVPAALTPAPPVASASVSSTTVGHELIGDIQQFAQSLGSHATGNFLEYSSHHSSDTRCYFTGTLELPEFYSSLKMVREDESRCLARAGEHDVFFYPVEAVASGHEAITVSLAESPTERLLVVVPHEDFHNQRELQKAPVEVAEAASTLVGFLTASAFARERFGEDAATTRLLAQDAELFLRKSLIVNQYYEQVSAVYGDLRAGVLTRDQALARKAQLFGELQTACSAIAPEPASFNKCPAAMNNAGLAFDRTYTRYYPLMHGLYALLNRDTTALVSTLKRLLVEWPSAVTTAAELLKGEACAAQRC